MGNTKWIDGVVKEDASYPWSRVQKIYDIAQCHDWISGTMLRDEVACSRLAFLRMHRCSLADISASVLKGEALHETSHTRSAKFSGLYGLRPDMLDLHRHVVIEKKSSANVSQGAVLQLGFYCCLLAGASGLPWHGELYFFHKNRKRFVPINEDFAMSIEESVKRVIALKTAENFPMGIETGLCQGCSEQDFCGR